MECAPACEGAAPVCDETVRACVGDADCTSGRCDTSAQVCVACLGDDDRAAASVCNADQGCAGASTAASPVCDAGTCGVCTAASTVCDAGTCGVCTADTKEQQAEHIAAARELGP